MTNYKKIGIIGGMGPESTALLYRQVVRSFQDRFGAYKDQDFPEMLIHNLPIPDITVDKKHEEDVRKMLSRSVHFLEQSGSELIAFPCNSFHLPCCTVQNSFQGSRGKSVKYWLYDFKV